MTQQRHEAPSPTGGPGCDGHQDVPLLPPLTCNFDFFHNFVGGVVDVDGHVDGLSVVVDLWQEEVQLREQVSLFLGTHVVA